MQWGRFEDKLKEQAKNTGELPLALQNKPFPTLFEQQYYDAFLTLSNGRQMGFDGPLPLQISEILAYLESIEAEDVEDYIYILQRMDEEYLRNARQKK